MITAPPGGANLVPTHVPPKRTKEPNFAKILAEITENLRSVEALPSNITSRN